MNDKLEKQIEEIVKKYHLDGYCFKNDADLSKCVEELTSLISQREKEAVEGFAKWVASHLESSGDLFLKKTKEYLITKGKNE
jgi:hypothetical protein